MMAPSDPVRIENIEDLALEIANALVAGSLPQDIANALFAGPQAAMLQVSGTAALNGDNQLIAAPAAGTAIYVVGFVIQNESAIATTMQLINGSGGDGWRCLGQNQGDGLAMTFPLGQAWKLTDATALILNLSAANSCGYSVLYYIQ